MAGLVATAGLLIAAESSKSLPPPDLESLRRALRQAAALLPAPERPYAHRQEEAKLEIGASVPWDPKAKVWLAPAVARATLEYDVPQGAGGVSAETRDLLAPIEIRLELNGEVRFADLASEGDSPSLFTVRDGTAVEVSLIAPGAVQGRVAAMTPRQAEYRLTALTLFIGDPALEASVRSAVKRGTTTRARLLSTSEPAEVHLIAVQLRGPRKPVESLARRIPASSLRQLLER